MIEVNDLSMIKIAEAIKNKKLSCVEIVKYYLDRAEKYKNKNAVLESFQDSLDKAKEWDVKISKGEKLPALAGVPILIKDNILYEGHKASCASKILENYVAQYTCTALQNLINAGAIVIGRCNMDEFAMGGSCENSAFGPCKNAYDDSRVSGGSSGGSAVAVALGLCAAALGTDTGASIRQPSAFNGVIGLKGSYGRVSRYGAVAYASSLDQIGPITKTVEDAALLMQIMAGKDCNDMTSSQLPVPDYVKQLNPVIKGMKIGFIKEVEKIAEKSPYYKNFYNLRNWLKEQGAEVIEVSVKNYELSVPVYYVIASAEAASNLGRYDGVKYTIRSAEAKNIDEVYTLSRSEGFGKEVKRRIMIGNFVLSSGYYDAYYAKAKIIQKALSNDIEKAFKKCDIIYLPTSYDEAFKIGGITDPVAMYMEDIFTVIANLTGIPAISVPFEKGRCGLPIGLQIMSKKFNEQILLNAAAYIEKYYKEGK